ncbi:bacterial Ig-like domain-containing protein [Lapidilactobacillus wuchangensis]|uniref:bacterial Ig-like domain-containing protein n=1 Tax=Lapidilactobacillus wuchangensis TaxID=2486001 RepID=UPI0013DE0722|nr:bacterial Ig-like domain-containing protein [Lapidilactobacillus wuchangensis]
MTIKHMATHTLNLGKKSRLWLSVGLAAVTLQAQATAGVQAATLNQAAADTTQLASATPTKEYEAANATTNIASGVYGTSQWWLDANQVLHIGAGQLGAPVPLPINGGSNIISYWTPYKAQITKIVFEDAVVANPDSTRLFMGLDQVVTIDNLTNLDTSQVTNANLMFSQCKSLISLDLSHFDTANMTNMSAMFSADPKLQSLDLSSFNTSQVTNMAYMFTSDAALTSINVSSFDTSKVTTTMNMFMMCNALTTLDLANFDLRNDTETNNMISRVPKLRKLTLGANFRNGWSYLRGDFGPDYSSHQWVSLNTGKTYTVEDPDSETDLFNSNYLSAETATADTYVWYYEPFTLKNVTITAGTATTWSAADNFVAQTDSAVTVADTKVVVTDPTTGAVLPTVPTNKPGTYQVTYQATDPISGYVYQPKATVTVLPSKTKIDVTNTTLISGPTTSWQPADSFVTATDANGQLIGLEKVAVTGAQQVDPSKPGEYPVTYTYTDALNNVVTQVAVVQVIASKAAITTNESTIIAGPNATWQASDGLLSATDANGQPLTINDLTVTGADQIDPEVPGTYLVGYHYTDQAGNELTQTASVKVVASAASLTVKDSQIQAGQTWQPADNFVQGTTAAGQPLDFGRDVTVTGQVDADQAGTYPITYHYVDASGNELTKTIVVTVLAKDVVAKTPDTPTIILPKTGQPVANKVTRATVKVNVPNNQVNQISQAAAQSAIVLPKTGERSSKALVLAGLTLLGLGGLLALGLNKKRQN